MSEVTVKENPRASAVVKRIGRLTSESAGVDAVCLGLVDAVLQGDADTLDSALNALRGVRADAAGDERLVGCLEAAIAFAYWGLERVPAAACVEPGTQAHDFLAALDGRSGMASSELRQLLETDETQVSRTGRRLLDRGLATRRKVGKQVFWHLSPNGRRALEHTPARELAGEAFWRHALLRGFEGVKDDEPGRPAQQVVRDRIVESTLELHRSQGIQATTWDEIAAHASVPIDTVRDTFSTQDELVRACGAHFLQTLRVPPPDRAAEVFTGASSEHERIRRLVETSFDVYERGADGIEAGRRERAAVPVAGEAVDALEESMKAIVAAAIEPRRDRSSVTSVRALTDLEVWRALRHRGATPEAAVEQGAEAVERWLEAQPALA